MKWGVPCLVWLDVLWDTFDGYPFLVLRKLILEKKEVFVMDLKVNPLLDLGGDGELPAEKIEACDELAHDVPSSEPATTIAMPAFSKFSHSRWLLVKKKLQSKNAKQARRQNISKHGQKSKVGCLYKRWGGNRKSAHLHLLCLRHSQNKVQARQTFLLAEIIKIKAEKNRNRAVLKKLSW